MSNKINVVYNPRNIRIIVLFDPRISVDTNEWAYKVSYLVDLVNQGKLK